MARLIIRMANTIMSIAINEKSVAILYSCIFVCYCGYFIKTFLPFFMFRPLRGADSLMPFIENNLLFEVPLFSLMLMLVAGGTSPLPGVNTTWSHSMSVSPVVFIFRPI